MKILIDMNLSPEWGLVFVQAGWVGSHWSKIGDPTAPDAMIMEWARRNDHIVFTHDLDFGALLAATGATGPSVVQLRCEDTRPAEMGDLVVAAMRTQEPTLDSGALMTLDPRRLRISILPLKKFTLRPAGEGGNPSG